MATATLVRLVDARGTEVAGRVRVQLRATRADGSEQQVEAEIGAGPYLLPLDAGWTRATVRFEHPDYLPLDLQLRAGPEWGDAATVRRNHPQGALLEVPLGRVRFAPGQIPPAGSPSGAERGVYLFQNPGRQEYVGMAQQLLPVPRLYTLVDVKASVEQQQTCVLDPHEDGWKRLSFTERTFVQADRYGGFAWLEYGSPETRPTQPRFLIAVYIPLPGDATPEPKLDALVFFSPSTDNDLYHPSTYPFRDKYPYAAYGRPMINPETKQKLEAKVQPYIHLGLKYLFYPSHLATMSAFAVKRPLVVMPIAPRVAGPAAATQMWQPFNSQAGLWRLLEEIKLFLQREGYTTPAYNPKRLNGAVAPTSGQPSPPTATFTADRQPPLSIRNIVVSGYSSGSRALYRVFGNRAISGSSTDFPPELFGADPAEFDRRWQECWALDLFLNPKLTTIPRTEYQNTLRSWLTRGDRRLRMYHSSWTLDADPDAFLPQFRKLLTRAPLRRTDRALPSRWAVDWRDPNGQWSALFLSGPFLRARSVGKDIVPAFPIGTPDGATGDPAATIHPFIMGLGFGHATGLR